MMNQQIERDLREAIVRTMKLLDERGLNRGTSGNVSVRLDPERILITPTGITPHKLRPEDIVIVERDGSTAPGSLKPSSEWQMHQRLLQGRTDINAVLHCHSRHATILACAGRPIPAMHYMVAVSGGSTIPVAPYATFGTAELADGVIEALAGRHATLMANHGQIVVAKNLDVALAIAEEVEEQAAVYWGTLAIGGPNLLDDGAMSEIFRRFATYGQRSTRADE